MFLYLNLHKSFLPILILCIFLFADLNTSLASGTTSDIIKMYQKLHSSEGFLSQLLQNGDQFGRDIENIGDLDGDGIIDLVVGAPGNDSGGAVYILFMNNDGSLKDYTEISAQSGGLEHLPNYADNFGESVTSLGDLDGDGIVDIAVGAQDADDGDCSEFNSNGNCNFGEINILFLNTNGTVKNQQKISNTDGFLGDVISYNSKFGKAVENIGDLDGDGIIDLVVGADKHIFANNSYQVAGEVFVLFLNNDGTVKDFNRISSNTLNIPDSAYGTAFANNLSRIGDLDGDGNVDFAVSSDAENDLGTRTGAIFIFFMNNDGSLKDLQEISNSQGLLGQILPSGSRFGRGMSFLGDFNLDGTNDIAVGSFLENGTGAVRLLSLNPNGTVKSFFNIFGEDIDGTTIFFGFGLSNIGDLDGDGIIDLVVGAPAENNSAGALYILFLKDLISNQAPVFSLIGNLIIAEGQTLNFHATATDPDSDALTYSAQNLPSGSTYSSTTGEFTWTPGYEDAGLYENIIFIATDNDTPILSASTSISIEVFNTNRTPVLSVIGNKTVNEGQTLSFAVSATDSDGDNLTYSASNTPQGSVFNPQTGIFSWTPDYSDEGNYTDIEFAVTDDGSPMELDVELITITVGNVNRAPILNNPGPQTVLENELLSFTVSATDPDGDLVTLSASSTPTGSTFNTTTGVFQWTPSLSDEGIYTAIFIATDDGSPNEQTVLNVIITVGDNPTPTEQAEDLVETVIEFNLPNNVENSYLANLHKVEQFILDGKINPAINQLNAFMNKVEQDYQQGQLTTEEYDSFISAVNNLLQDLNNY